MTSPPFIKQALAQLFLCLCIIVLQYAGAFSGFESRLIEKRAELAPRPATQQIVYISIDHQSLDEIGVWPWPRSVHARIIEALVDAEAADIVFDVDFSSRSDPAEDARLLQALQSAGGSVVLPTFTQQRSIRSQANGGLVQTKPQSLFQNDSWMASVRVNPDRDGIVRSMYRGDRMNGEIVPSAAAVLAGQPEPVTSRFLIDFSINPDSVPTYSVSDLLAGAIPAAALRDRSVIVGAHALELRDTFAVPVHTLVPGTMLQILAAETLLQDRVILPSSIWLTAILVLVVLGVALVCASQFGLAARLAALALVSLFFELVAVYLQMEYAIALTTVPALTAAVALGVFAAVTELNLLTLLVRIMKMENRNTRKVLGQVFADSDDGFLVIRKDGRVLEINDNFRKLFNLSEEQVSNRSVFEHLPASVVEQATKSIAKYEHQKCSAVIRSEYRQTTDDGEKVMEYSVTPSVLAGDRQKDPENEGAVFITIAARDVSLQRQQEAKLVYLSRHDDLTGALQRREYVKLLSQHLVDVCAEDGLAVVCAFNIRRFNALNRTLGRRTGDRLLKAIVSRLARIEIPVSRVARLEGDTFVLHFVADMSKSGIRHLGNRLIRELNKPYDLEDLQVSAEFYAGVAEASDLLRQDADGLIANAELALASARAQGCNVAYFDPNDVAQQERALLIERDMRNGLRNNQFSVAYQPQVSTADRRPVGAEALLRWTHTELGSVGPEEFIEIAEASGFIAELGRWVLTKACLDALRWPDHVTIAVNVSAKQFLRGSVIDDVRQALKTSGLPARRLELEITESSFLQATDDLLVQLADLKKLGVSVSLDDFGTGYSSFGYLARFPVDKIKIDRMFLKHITGNSGSQSVVRSAQVLADGLGMKVLCEGVETMEQYEIIREIGCQQIQGFYFGRPQTAEEIEMLFRGTTESALKDAG